MTVDEEYLIFCICQDINYYLAIITLLKIY